MPREIEGISAVKQVVLDETGGCVLLAAGPVDCWGENFSGQVGSPELLTKFIHPRPVPGLSGAQTIAAGWWHVCAALSDGSVSCWGDDEYGELGDGNSGLGAKSYAPVHVAGGSALGAVQLAASYETTCALGRTGAVRCFGENEEGQAGIGSTTPQDVLSPTSAVGVESATQFAQGERHSCALERTGTVVCWGSNSHAELGNGKGEYGSDPQPRPVVGLP